MRHDRYVPFAPAAELFAKDPNDGITAARIGCTTRSIIRWRSSGRIPLRWVDPIAVAYGMHPDLIWGHRWDDPDD